LSKIKHVIFWAFLAGVLHGILLAIEDYRRRKEMRGVDQSSPSE